MDDCVAMLQVRFLVGLTSYLIQICSIMSMVFYVNDRLYCNCWLQNAGDHQTEGSSQPERNSLEEGNRKISPKMQSKEDSSDGDGTKEDYVHVRAKRGQATNSHSLAERVDFSLVVRNCQFSLLYSPLLTLEVDENICS